MLVTSFCNFLRQLFHVWYHFCCHAVSMYVFEYTHVFDYFFLFFQHVPLFSSGKFYIFSITSYSWFPCKNSMCIAPPSFAMSYINLPFHCLCRLLLYFYYLIFILVSYCFLGCHLTFAGKSRLCNGYKAEWFNLNYIFFWWKLLRYTPNSYHSLQKKDKVLL